MPPSLKAGDKVRFVSPASTPEREAVLHRAHVLRSWGLDVDFGEHAFDKDGYLAGTDDQRLADVNAALRDPTVRAIFATRGGKGSYRIADRLDFATARRDPKFLVGFSDITILHLSLWRECRLVGLHGALMDDDPGCLSPQSAAALKSALMRDDAIVLRSRDEEPTAALTTNGRATGPLIGGNLSMIATAAGWALPDLRGAILLIEAVNMYVGQVDRQLTMLRKAGHLAGLAGVAVGQFTDFKPSDGWSLIDLLRDHLAALGVPILGGLPLGHGSHPLAVPVGSMACLDATARTLTVARSTIRMA
ncbi:LD-carboxypeptidase [Reyranella sp. CPCC 100927]|uniref:S66 peptidase family protein n=1 Tax=Reyranella sp. CPCC 100927 TaxID=2599616 RepID=UPI0011B53DDD|nr:LD-carboxypeptidase [Reyranella sp. CPCC 100927]TWS95956.1 LD-carboxypeptidase [Reyranella sp. CPCC 100927]